MRKINKAGRLKYFSKMTSIALNNFKNNFCKGKESNVAMRKRVLLIIFVWKLFDVSCFRVILVKLFFIKYSFQLSFFFELTVHETGKLVPFF